MNRHLNIQQTILKMFTISFAGKLAIALALSVTMLSTVFGIYTTRAHAATNTPDRAALENMIRAEFGPHANQAIRIAMCESTMNPNATNSISIGGSRAAGLFQILYPSTWKTTSQVNASPYDPRANIKAAHEIFLRDGSSWREWECRA